MSASSDDRRSRQKRRIGVPEIGVSRSFNFGGPEAHEAAKSSDVIICCVDADSGRDYASYIASRYHKILIDIGTGVIIGTSDSAAKRGYDVRMILPGDGCLRCCGGLDRPQAELEVFNRDEQQRQRSDGRRQRGSLSTLNVAAVSEGIVIRIFVCELSNDLRSNLTTACVAHRPVEFQE